MENSIFNTNLHESYLLITSLYTKYSQNEYMLQRLHSHITKNLSPMLELEDKAHERKITRNEFLTNEQQLFIQVFFNNNKYYYLQSNNKFYVYDGKNYSMVKEDIIQHNLLTSISNVRTFMDWKYKTKVNIIKLIKERNLFTSIPESYTIQKVLNTLQPLFSNKNQAKYFLTIMGDNILKKNNELSFLIKPKSKKYLLELSKSIGFVTGIQNTLHIFFTKYHINYFYENCRLLKMENNISLEMWVDILSKEILDIICVATHYSQRFKNSDNFIMNNVNNEELKNYVLYLKNNNKNDILNKFCSHSIDNMSGEKIGWKNFHLIWKLYISQFSLPNIIYSNNLKQLLMERYEYNESTDLFNNITSKYIPYISNFINFWEKTITIIISPETHAYELEIDELCILYKYWRQENNINFIKNTSENDIIKILNHFFPSIEIIENKFILKANSNMWNKNMDIKQSINSLHIHYKELYTIDPANNNSHFISFEEAYDYYNNFINSLNNDKPFICIVSKRYFNNYLQLNLSSYILHENFISPLWYITAEE